MLTIEEAVKYYIRCIENDSPIVSTSHYVRYHYALKFGDEAWDKAIEEYFAEKEKEHNKL